MTEPLSPAAQAVLDAYVNEDRAGRLAVAAALRAAAYQVVPNDELAAPTWTDREEVRAALLAIADELAEQS